ncbi:hypothetical protein FHR90_002757 [Endobacter medicaginis]|uniref:Glycosyl transferase n=2 Tax=Endobacter medicaginis TaxID=1181271 RepID=A0A839V309_9PROT|nr:hypothetical protein [Endobacter medicaginis]MBB3174910.1 hypothetical protein [Endobacter medicaginis]MCX5475873.1 hypothetical protein [Endobacter medicaginis]
MRIGFLYNHDATHQIPHTIMVAAALAARGVDVEILTSTEDQDATARDLLPASPPGARPVRFTALSIRRPAQLADLALRHVAPYRRVAILRENLDRLAGFDALVVPETTSTLLRSRYGVTGPKLIYIPHGAGDGAAGFQPATRRFDLVLLSGAKVRDRMLAAGLVSEAGSAIVGYPKFDLGTGAAPPLFANGRPTVVYNPHFNPKLSSWYRFGPAILRWFAAQDRFNLIFAPHVMLFRRTVHTSLIHRRVALRPPLPRGLAGLPHVLIDTGSRRSIDMSYIRAADLYLGDVSSQIYEWIQRPRPAVLIDTHGPDWRGAADYGQWRLGELIERLDALAPALDRALADPHRFADVQAEAAARTFSIEARPAAERAADAILAYMAR